MPHAMPCRDGDRATEKAGGAGGEDNLRQDLQLSFHRGHTSFFVKGRVRAWRMAAVCVGKWVMTQLLTCYVDDSRML